jgi:ell wall binding domain 2 (CWB2)/WD40-like Beta Propeller Repeat
MSRVRRRRTAAVASVAAAAILPLAFMPGAAQAISASVGTGLQAYVTGTGANASIAFNYDNGGGSNPSTGTVPATIRGAIDPVWEPDGRRVVYATASGGSIRSTDVYTGSTITLTAAPSGYADYPGTVSPDGRFVAFTRVDTSTGDGSVYIVATDGSWSQFGGAANAAEPAFTNDGVTSLDTGAPEMYPVSAPDGDIVVDRGNDIVDINVSYDNQGDESVSFQTIVAGASQPTYSPDGQYLAFVKDVDGVAQLWTANADGSDPQQTSFDASGAAKPAWSPDGRLLSYGSTAGAMEVQVTEGSSGLTFGTPSAMQAGTGETSGTWQPLASGAGVVTRVSGGIAIETAIAASQHNYASVGAVGNDGTDSQGRIPAGAVVLSRSNEFYDALAGSAFAADEHAPLLMTPTASLNSEVKGEIQRILPSGGTVYLLGGDQAISPAVESSLNALGYKTTRLAGSNMYGTAVKVDQAITAQTGEAFAAIVATGTQYYDALAAGAAAGSLPGTVIVLTQGTTMPAASAAYLNSLENQVDGVPITFTAGGPGNTAMQNALNDGVVNWGAEAFVEPLVGSNAPQTALKIAQTFFAGDLGDGGAQTVAIATTKGWYDALTGGAMVAVDGGPLLLTSPTSLDPGVAAYLQAENGSLDSAEILGGTSAMPNAILDQVQNLIGLPDGIGGIGGAPVQLTATRTPEALTAKGSSNAAQTVWSRALNLAHSKAKRK